MKIFSLIITSALLLVTASQAFAVETEIMIRARSQDAKFIGSSVGGVRVIIEDSESGRLLDEGWITGGTGDTERLMQTPHKRGTRLTDDNTAGYLASVDIDQPVHVRIKLFAPYGNRQALQQSELTTWLIPGKHIKGDGLIVKMPGLIVDGWTQFMTGNKLNITADITMLCGCPISADGLWLADSFEVTAMVKLNGKSIDDVPLKFISANGFFMGEMPTSESGVYEILIYAYQASTGNVGVVRTQRKIKL